jgi:hypothetical protein
MKTSFSPAMKPTHGTAHSTHPPPTTDRVPAFPKLPTTKSKTPKTHKTAANIPITTKAPKNPTITMTKTPTDITVPPSTFTISKPNIGISKICTLKFYAVGQGCTSAINTNRSITQAQVHSFSGALFQGFHDYSQGQNFLYVYTMDLSMNNHNYLQQILATNTNNINVHINSPPATTTTNSLLL